MNIFLKLSEDIKKDEFIKNIISARESKNISIQAAAQYLHISTALAHLSTALNFRN